MTPSEVAHRFDPRRVGEGRWVARCPAHDHKTPSLSIKDGADGKTLQALPGVSVEEALENEAKRYE